MNRPGGRIGVLGGVFDPPHVGHLTIALAALEQLALDRLLVVPSGVPPLGKQPRASGAQRTRFAERVFGGNPRVTVTDIELHRPASVDATYTVDTLRELSREHPGARMVLVLGADQARALAAGHWRSTAELLELCELAFARRPGVSDDELATAIDALRAQGAIVVTIANPLLRISSTALRAALEAGDDQHPLLSLVPEISAAELVAAYATGH